MSDRDADSNGTDISISLFILSNQISFTFYIEGLTEYNRHIVFTKLFWEAHVDL